MFECLDGPKVIMITEDMLFDVLRKKKFMPTEVAEFYLIFFIINQFT